MTVRQTAEVTVSDLTDAYSVTLSSYNATFQADTTKWTSGSTAVVVQAVCGSSQVDCNVPNTGDYAITVTDNASADASAKVTVSVSKATGSYTPVVTITGTSNATVALAPYTVTIPVTVAHGSDTLVFTQTVTVSLSKTGAAGTGAYNYFLTVSPDAVVKAEDGTLSPSSVTLSSTRLQGTGSPAAYAGRFKVEKYVDGAWVSTAVYTSSTNESSHTVNVPTDSGLTLLRCTLYLAGGTTTMLEQRTVPIVSDGPTGSQGIQGIQGNAGADAYTVVLSNDAHTFAATANGAAVAGSVAVSVIAYKGATQVAATIGTITGTVTGLTAPISSNGTTSAYFTATATTSLTTRSGVLTVPITVDGHSFTKKFSWSLAPTGATGPAGEDGLSMSITSSAGTVFRNSTGSTVLTAHVWQSGAEVTGSDLTALGTIKWYKDGTLISGATGATYTVQAAAVDEKAVYTAKLEG